MADLADPLSKIGGPKPADRSRRANDLIADWRRWSQPERLVAVGFTVFWITVQSSLAVLLGR